MCHDREVRYICQDVLILSSCTEKVPTRPKWAVFDHFSRFWSRGRCVRARALVPREPRQAHARTLCGTLHERLQVNKLGPKG